MAAAAGSAFAQPGRVGGLIKDDSGAPIKGATIVAENPNIGQTLTATTDDKGRFTMIGLSSGQWRFIAQAPGHLPQATAMQVRTNGALNAPMSFSLRRTDVTRSGAFANISAKDLQASLKTADDFFNQQKWDEAIAAYKAIAARTPALAIVNLQVGAAYRSKKNYDAAIDAYREVLKVEPANANAHVSIALTQLERGDVKGAEETLTQAAAQPAAGKDVLYQLGELKRRAGALPEAMEWFDKAAAADRAWGKPLYGLGLCAIENGNRAKASDYMAQVIAVDPASTEAALAKTALADLNK
jgi:tetratricopeptide (TPR) repeat protein